MITEKIKSMEQLAWYRRSVAGEIAVRENGDDDRETIRVSVSMNDTAVAAGAQSLLRFFAAEAANTGRKITVTPRESIEGCGPDPVIRLDFPDGSSRVFGGADPEKAERIAEKYLRTE